ncbi:hypothetical protein [Leeuwenhoekiella marinoflava]|uniref:LTXXQ motif family protein n=2 Tax=Leeuwenhoekiella marinoflava TaxID=988 RepID=A0A4V1KS37_9FLAO|nr:hypothetical protein [Leeuwenhoekiella marinoflava]RXG27355.1 hypothetical protein DSL99_2879 [Leeuwenhoekiella marinoflava]SHF71627.1 hypothetical protein SAMN02745246_03245 [Leeuwenhoekiella marinoflava DSM 3653]
MKNLIVIVALFVSVTALAQQGNRGQRFKKMMDATPEEMAEMQTKRLTLALVLDDKQQKDIYGLELVAAKERKVNWEQRAAKMKARAGEKPSEEEREAMRKDRKEKYVAMLDKQIAHQEKMQKILNEEQFDQWRKLKMKRHNRMANRDGKRGDRPQRHRDSGEGRK